MPVCRCGAALSGQDFARHWRRFHSPSKWLCAECDYSAGCLSDAVTHALLEGHGLKQRTKMPLELIHTLSNSAEHLSKAFDCTNNENLGLTTVNEGNPSENEPMSKQDSVANKKEPTEIREQFVSSESLPKPCLIDETDLKIDASDKSMPTIEQKTNDMKVSREASSSASLELEDSETALMDLSDPEFMPFTEASNAEPAKNDDQLLCSDSYSLPEPCSVNTTNIAQKAAGIFVATKRETTDITQHTSDVNTAPTESITVVGGVEEQLGEAGSIDSALSNGSLELQYSLDSEVPEIAIGNEYEADNSPIDHIPVEFEPVNRPIDLTSLKGCDARILSSSDKKSMHDQPSTSKNLITNGMQELDLPEPSNQAHQRRAKRGFNSKPLPETQCVRKRRHSCLMCGKSYTHSVLKDHISTQHYKQPLFRCKLCPYFTYLYMNDLLMRDHVRRKHQATKFDGWKPYFTDHRREHLSQLSALAQECFPGLCLEFQGSKLQPFETPGNDVQIKDKPISNGVVSSGAVSASRCNLCRQAVAVSQRKNHIMLEHSDSAAVFKCRHCSHCSPYWTGEFKQLAKHLANNHPGKGHWRKEMHDRRAQLSPFMSAMTELCFPFTETKQTEIKEDAGIGNSADVKLETNIITGYLLQACNKCGKSLESINKHRDKADHVNTHLPSDFITAQCHLCRRTFKELRNARGHAKTVHAMNDWASVTSNWSNAKCVIEGRMKTYLDCFPGNAAATAFFKYLEPVSPSEYDAMPPAEKTGYSNARRMREDMLPVDDFNQLPGLLPPKQIGDAVIVSGNSEEWKCQLCAQISCRQYLASHVWNRHYAKVAFSCRCCSFSISRVRLDNRANLRALRNHLRTHFPIPGHQLKPSDTLSNYENNFHGNEEFQAVAAQCFPKWAQLSIRDILQRCTD